MRTTIRCGSRRSATIGVDGEPIEFLVAEAGRLSAAAAAIGELDVSLLTRAVRIDDLELFKIDLSDYQRHTGPTET